MLLPFQGAMTYSLRTPGVPLRSAPGYVLAGLSARPPGILPFLISICEICVICVKKKNCVKKKKSEKSEKSVGRKKLREEKKSEKSEKSVGRKKKTA